MKHGILYEHFVAQVVPKAFPEVQLMVPTIKSGKKRILITVLSVRQHLLFCCGPELCFQTCLCSRTGRLQCCPVCLKNKVERIEILYLRELAFPPSTFMKTLISSKVVCAYIFNLKQKYTTDQQQQLLLLFSKCKYH